MTYAISELELVIDAVMAFNEGQDPKAGVLAGFHVETSSTGQVRAE